MIVLLVKWMEHRDDKLSLQSHSSCKTLNHFPHMNKSFFLSFLVSRYYLMSLATPHEQTCFEILTLDARFYSAIGGRPAAGVVSYKRRFSMANSVQ